ncbi:hypothetical protein LTR62_001966 [Meristemomyces frigidus]|uniref:Glutathione S-transferase UstS-like C-terminal domain-containing protein n=1 Tax=Meristemomyces frigidus TaxID=1508187 RepID=A0AAN7TAK5_9PEZI|nr:hypothetical protein LTR62_001966 [Meristemomyces frigidus]
MLPSLHLETGHQETARKLVGQIFNPIAEEFMVSVRDEWLEEPTKTWFHEDRRRRFKATPDEVAAPKAGQEGWEVASQPVFGKLKDLLTSHTNDDGPFITGSKPCYEDFVVVSIFESMKRVARDRYEQLIAYDKSFKTLHEACQPCLEKDGEADAEPRKRLKCGESTVSQLHLDRQNV